MELKDLLRTRRLELNLSMEEVGRRVGVSKQTIQKWESGKISNVKRSNIAALSQALNIPITELMGWSEDLTPDTSPVSENRRKLLEFVESVPEDKAARVLRLMQAILEDEQ